ncbi:MAG: hypothetical protein M3R15_28280, partial [Acidobacteriota bacterium]|nr:hypothetical protein [Acidobacteriota bacterium]
MSHSSGSLDERTKSFIASLQGHPELQARFEGVLALVENTSGDTLTADDAEQRVVESVTASGTRGVAVLGTTQCDRLRG